MRGEGKKERKKEGEERKKELVSKNKTLLSSKKRKSVLGSVRVVEKVSKE